MLWYLLYPFRRTVQPPRLSADHPIRRAFYRHGKTTAQHWLVTMLLSVAIAMAFSYPTIFLSQNPTAGLGAYPHHAWTTAKPYQGDVKHTDVEMRQVWVHGSYMRALDRDVLKNALRIQQTLVGSESMTSTFQPMSETLRSSTLSWGYHSPLMYWNSSQEVIENDDDILRTINEQAKASSSLNVALRPASVFAGKKFSHRQLISADALVITLMNKFDNGVGGHWQERMTSLTSGACQNCTLFPQDGHVMRSKVYEFSFTPLSLHENLLFAFAYGCMGLYVLLSLRRMKAFHSRFGLVVTAITQMTCSVLASFTICGMLKINLSMIPRNAYPFLVLVIGLENMFRLINAVLAYPPTMATELRIATALGDIGPVSVATAGQNFVILSLLSRVVSPGVAAFCSFACIATVFDAFFLLTFFVAVLNVDIRRFELQDALARANRSRPRRKPSPAHDHTWFDALVHGRLPFSTRMAGTAVTTTFILSLNYHFFEHREQATSLRYLLSLLRKGPPTLNEFDTFAPPPMNASLTPGQWMRMQDFDTAKEVMRLAKPGGDSFIIRVFAPLIVVLPGADRTEVTEHEAWSTALRSFAVHHFYPVAVAVVFAVAFVAVLMNFLLYSEPQDEHDLVPDSQNSEKLSVRAVDLPHKLDIVKLAGTEKGHLVTVGLDRSIAVCTYDEAERAYRILSLSQEILNAVSWPIQRTKLDGTGTILALQGPEGSISVYNCNTGRFIQQALHSPDDNLPVLFEFTRLTEGDSKPLHLMLLTSSGRMAISNIETDGLKQVQLTDATLLGSCLIDSSAQEKQLLVITDQAELISYTWRAPQWVRDCSVALPVSTTSGRLTGAVHIRHHWDIDSGLLVVTTPRCVILLNSRTLQVRDKVDVGAESTSVCGMLVGQTGRCPECGGIAFDHAALVDEKSSDDDCTVTALTGAPYLCLDGNKPGCISFDQAKKTQQKISQAGAWDITASQTILGLRKRPSPPLPQKQTSYLRRRRATNSSTQTESEQDDEWEGYTIDPTGNVVETAAAPPVDAALEAELHGAASSSSSSPSSLYVSEVGPAAILGPRTLAVAFGDSVKIIRAADRGGRTRRPTGRSLERPAVSAAGL